MKKISNKEKYPEAWAFYVEHARNMMEENYEFNYRIPIPDLSGNFINADTPEQLWSRFIRSWFNTKQGLNSPSIYEKIQYIVNTF